MHNIRLQPAYILPYYQKLRNSNRKAGDDMSVKVKTTFNTKKMMSDIKTQAKASLEKKSFDIECPHCKKSFSAHKGHNVCPYCNNAVTLNLNINF